MALRPEFVDTNVFLRYLTNDVPEQADAVERLLQGAAREERLLVTTALVIAEVVWTLESYYRLPRGAIQEAVFGILNTPGLEVEGAETVLQAMAWYRERNVDFADAFHAAWMLEGGLEIVHTFDRIHFGRFEHVSVSVPGLPGR
ncbi:PIN domain-containing protein [soil metagenome]